MTPLLKKEIRLLLPAWLAVLCLEVGQPWITKDQDMAISAAPVFFFFGMVLLAVDSFGREFSLGTFSGMMSLPVDRRQLWQTKLRVLLLAALLIFIPYFLSCDLRLHHSIVATDWVWTADPTVIHGDFTNAMLASGAVLLVALTGGLWTALLLRQTTSAFWIALLAPIGLGLLVLYLLSLIFPHPSPAKYLVFYFGLAGLYITGAFGLAHRLFFRVEDAGWTGGVISFSRWRYFENTRPAGISVRQHRPVAALLKKELQLQSISLFGALALLALHIGVFFLRGLYVNSHRSSIADVASECFWILWLVLPLVIGCTAVAEERKLGVMDGQFCLPVGRRLQFWTKLAVTLVVGVILGGVMPLLLETLAGRLGFPSETFKNMEHPPGLLLVLAAGVAAVGFAASTLARNFLQALSIAIVLIVAACLGTTFLITFAQQLDMYQQRFVLFGLIPDSWGLFILFSLPVLVVLLPWLVWRNYNFFQESARLWRRNVVVILGSLACVLAGSAALYQRPWELLQPAEPPHGPARFSLATTPRLHEDGPGGLRVTLPDGRVWCDRLGYDLWSENPGALNILWVLLAHPLPTSSGPRAFLGESNWVSTTTRYVDFWNPKGFTADSTGRVAGYLDTVGIQSDGTLWINREAKPRVWTGAQMTRFGSETNWRQVARWQNTLVLLKTDGTLWQWGTNNIDWKNWSTHWPTVRDSQLVQIGTQSDWQGLLVTFQNDCYVQNQAGLVWSVALGENGFLTRLARETNRVGAARSVRLPETNGWSQLQRQPKLDQVPLRTLAKSSEDQMTYVGRDGALWFAGPPANGKPTAPSVRPFVRVGSETNWVRVAVTWHWLAALKSDGTLWQWQLHPENSPVLDPATPPIRLGIHQDWVAFTGTAWNGAVALAADGSLWYWPDHTMEAATWLRLPRQPQALGNIFAVNQTPIK